jgi:hypothetical protein
MTGYESKNDNDVRAKKAIEEYKSASSAVQIASAGLDAGKKAVIEAMKNNSEFLNSGFFVKRENGSTDLFNEKDLSKAVSPYFKDKKLVEEITKQYFDGDLKISSQTRYPSSSYSGGSSFTMGTSDNSMVSGKGVTTTTITMKDGKKYILENSKINVPSPDKYKELTKKINTEVPPPEFGAAAGMVYGSPFYKLNGAVKQQVINTLGHITPTNSNIMAYDGTSEPTQVKPEVQQAVRNAIASKDSIAEITLMTTSPTNKGGQAVQVKFAVDLKKGDKDHPLAGQSFFFPITPTEASADIFNIFNKVKEVSEFEPYKKKGDIYHLDTFQAEGIKAEFIPTSPGSSQGVVRVYQKAYNDRTRSYSNDFQQIGTDVEYSLDNTSFPELKQMVYNSFIDPYVSGKIRYRQQTGAASGSTSSTPSSIYSNLLTKRN